MSKVNQMKREVERDISDIKEILESGDYDSKLNMHKYMDSKYQSKIKTWGLSQYGWVDNLGFDYDYIGLDAIADNLKNMIGKLESYKQDIDLEVFKVFHNSSNKSINIYNKNTNVNTNKNINSINFGELEEYLTNSQTMNAKQKKEAIKYLNDLQKIFESTDSKKRKWEKAKKIISWLLNKGVDIAIAYLPAITSMIGRYE